jgi:hypothetical protein
MLSFNVRGAEDSAVGRKNAEPSRRNASFFMRGKQESAVGRNNA